MSNGAVIAVVASFSVPVSGTLIGRTLRVRVFRQATQAGPAAR
jgi:hypothetical protein